MPQARGLGNNAKQVVSTVAKSLDEKQKALGQVQAMLHSPDKEVAQRAALIIADTVSTMNVAAHALILLHANQVTAAENYLIDDKLARDKTHYRYE